MHARSLLAGHACAAAAGAPEALAGCRRWLPASLSLRSGWPAAKSTAEAGRPPGGLGAGRRLYILSLRAASCQAAQEAGSAASEGLMKQAGRAAAGSLALCASQSALPCSSPAAALRSCCCTLRCGLHALAQAAKRWLPAHRAPGRTGRCPCCCCRAQRPAGAGARCRRRRAGCARAAVAATCTSCKIVERSPPSASASHLAGSPRPGCCRPRAKPRPGCCCCRPAPCCLH